MGKTSKKGADKFLKSEVPTLLMGIFSLLQTTRSSSGKAFVLFSSFFFQLSLAPFLRIFVNPVWTLELQLVKAKMRLNSFAPLVFIFVFFLSFGLVVEEEVVQVLI
jgi:hypothetical protein